MILTGCGGGGGAKAPSDSSPPDLRFVSFQTDQTVVQSGRFSISWIADDADEVATVSIFADGDGDIGTTTDRYTLVEEVAEANGDRQDALVDLTEVPGGTYAVVGRIRDEKGGERRLAAPGKLIVEDRAFVAPIGGTTIEIVDHLARSDGSFDVLGRFLGVVAFDARNRVSSTSRSWDLFVANYTARGVIRWLSRFECTGDMEASAFVRDTNGDLLIAGAFGGTLTLPDRSTIRGLGADVFVARVTASGEQSWVQTASSPNQDIGADIALLADGSFVVAGAFCLGDTTYGIEFGLDRSGRAVSLASAGAGDAFVARYESDGTPIWASSVGGAAIDRALATAVLPGDRIVVGGHFSGTAAFGDGSVRHTASGGSDGFLAEWSSTGQLVQVDTFVGSDEERIVDLARCADGDLIVLANSTSDTLDLAGRSTVSLAAGGGAALARFGPDGGIRWGLGAAVGPGPCAGAVLEPLADNSVLIAGTYASGARFGPGGPTLSAVGETDGFVSSLDADGSLQWLRRFSTPDADRGLAISAREDGTVLVTGDRGVADLEVYTERGEVTLPATGISTDFVARFNPDGELGRSPDLSTRVAGSATITRGRITVSVDGLTATLQGFDEVETTAAILQLIEDHPLVAMLVVQRANGPDRGSAHLEGARAIAAAGIETHIPSNGSIYGGGIDLFLAGRRRTAGQGATVGVRTWTDANRFTGYDVRGDRGHPAHQLYLDFYDALGVPDAYYWRSIQTPRNTHLELTRAELEQYSVVTD